MFRTARDTTGNQFEVSFTALACENICGRTAWTRPRCAPPAFNDRMVRASTDTGQHSKRFLDRLPERVVWDEKLLVV